MNATPRVLALACLMLPLAARCASSIVRDGSLGTGPTSALAALGTVNAYGVTWQRISIPETLGSRVGTNVFHSFQQFAIGSGDAAVFGIAAPTMNIISRVTGGQVSQIGGLLSVDAGTTGSRPNVYLINPAGVTFSAGSAVDVPAALHISTADVLTFPDGRFEADPARTSRLSSAEPAAFGFLGARSAAIRLEPGTFVQSAPGKPTSLTAGSLSIDSAVVGVANAELRLAAVGTLATAIPLTGDLPGGLGGLLYLGGNAVAGTIATGALPGGDVHISAGHLRMGDGLGEQGTLLGSLTADASTGRSGNVEIDVSGALTLDRTAKLLSRTNGQGNSGDVHIRAGSVAVDSRDEFSGIYTQATAASTGNAGNLSVVAAGALALNRGGQIFSRSSGSGDTGSVSVSGASVSMGGEGADTWIYTLNDGLGNAGPVSVSASGAVNLHAGASVWSQALEFGQSGAIHLKGNTILVEGTADQPSSISSTSRVGSEGGKGSISLEASNLLALHGKVAVGTIATDAGDAGNIGLSAGSIELDGQGQLLVVSTAATAGSTGAAGNIDILSRGALTLHDGAFVTSYTRGPGKAGDVRVQADSLRIEGGAARTEINSDAWRGSSGDAGHVSIKVNGALSLLSEGTISSSTDGSGNAGTINVDAGSILMDSRQKELFTGIASNALEHSSGHAGTVTVHAAGELTMLDYGEIASATQGSGGAGAIAVDAATIVLDNAQIAASATENSSGQIGAMVVRASASLTLRNAALLNLQNAATVADPTAPMPGALVVSAPVVRLSGANISSASLGNVAAGGITILASDRLTLEHNSNIFTAATRSDGGHIVIHGGKLVSVSDSVITTSVLEGQGNGGDIDLHADILLLRSGMIKANTGAAGASGGDVRIDAGALLTSGSSLLLGGSTRYPFESGIFGFNVIQAAAPTGVSGTVALSTPALDIAGALAGLAVPQIDAGGLGRNPCQAGGGSTLVRAGRGGFAPSARGWLAPAVPVPSLISLRQLDCKKG
ncbi:MAG: filamentous hemagglutinin N-terminal domain-containing protein [Pseudomonadota bacterium]